MARRLVMLAGVLFLILAFLGCSTPTPTPAAPPKTTTQTTSAAPQTTSQPSAAPKTTTAPSPTQASADLASFYKNNNATMIVPAAPGGGTDIVARLVASHWNQVTGGTMVVENESQGAGVAGMNRVYNAKPDGLTVSLAMFGPHALSPLLASDPAVQYDLNKFKWVSAFWDEPYLFAIGSKLAANTMADVQKMTGFKFGAMAPTATVALADALAIEAFGLKDARIITGLRGADVGLTLGKGEIDGMCYSGQLVLDYVAKGYAKKVLFVAASNRTKWLPDLPAIPELAKLSATQEKLLRSIDYSSSTKVVAVAAGVPDDKVAFLRNAFSKMLALQELQDKGKKIYPVLTDAISGADWAATVQKITQTVSKDDYITLAKMVQKYSPLK